MARFFALVLASLIAGCATQSSVLADKQTKIREALCASYKSHRSCRPARVTMVESTENREGNNLAVIS